MIKIVGIDPGKEKSGVVVVSEIGIENSFISPNPEVLEKLRWLDGSSILAIEQIRGYGIVAGDDTFDTCEWTGRFREAYEGRGGTVIMCPRKDIKRHFCGNTTTNDKYIRMALLDRLGCVGTKKAPGPLFGISGHLWAALAVAIYCGDGQGDVETR